MGFGVNSDEPSGSIIRVYGLGSFSYVIYFSNSEPSFNIMIKTHPAPEPDNLSTKRTDSLQSI
jgi:hypothetical protein